MISKLAKKLFNHFLRKSKNSFIDNVFISKELIKKYLPSNPVIIDCGAHIGTDSIELSEIVGSTIFALEAVDEVYHRLKENTKSKNNIKCFNLALSNYDGEADFYLSSGGSDGSSSLLKPKTHLSDHPEVLFDEVVKVKCLKLDTWARNNNISRVDMLWLDMQGFEQSMLAASEKILPTVSVIHTEVSMRETYEGVKTFEEFKSFLNGKGFKLIAKAIPTGYDMGNALFIRTNEKITS